MDGRKGGNHGRGTGTSDGRRHGSGGGDRGLPRRLRCRREKPPHGRRLRRDAGHVPHDLPAEGFAPTGCRVPPGPRLRLPQGDRRQWRFLGDPTPPLPRDARLLLLVHAHGRLRAESLHRDSQREGGSEGDPAALGGGHPGPISALRSGRRVRLPQPGHHPALPRHRACATRSCTSSRSPTCPGRTRRIHIRHGKGPQAAGGALRGGAGSGVARNTSTGSVGRARGRCF